MLFTYATAKLYLPTLDWSLYAQDPDDTLITLVDLHRMFRGHAALIVSVEEAILMHS